jgi:hypothetical protein
MSWTGWLWIGDTWVKACSAPTIGEAARQLGVLGEWRGIPTWMQVLTAGCPPAFMPAGEIRSRF